MVEKQLIVSLPGNALRRLIGPAPEGVTFVSWNLDGPAPLSHIDIVVPPYMAAPTQLSALQGISSQLVQSQSIGYDGVAEHLPAGHRFANASTVHETSTAELALALVLAMQRAIPDYVRAADQSAWAPSRQSSLADREVLLLGYGGVGQAIEARLIAFEVKITRVARTARDSDAGRIHSLADLPTLLPAADIVIVAVPLTSESTGLVDDNFLSLMTDGAMLVNVARGPVVVTDDLVAHLQQGRIRAALDVTDPEPLPSGHPLWSTPNTLITPHVGGASTAMMPRMAQLIRRQIEHVLGGNEPENLVLTASPTA